MRPSRRRCPAGLPQVPVPSVSSCFVATPIEPAIVRLAPDRTVLDSLWGLSLCLLALVWPEERAPGGWARAVWPVDPVSRRVVAPVDLHIGHVLEVSARRGSDWQPVYGWIADVDGSRFVVVPAVSVADAVVMAARAFDVWRAAELARVEDAWRQRFERATRFESGTS